MPFESVHNYYETLVFNEINQREGLEQAEDDVLCDVACVALNQLPTRYMRHQVDMIFYMTQPERKQIKDDVTGAVEFAVNYVKQHIDEDRPLITTQ
jgi:ABC-type phosphate transport system ATPase subunit